MDLLPHPNMTTITINSTSGEEAAINTAGITKLLDRCWCDITSSTSFFDPFNTTRWELASIRASIPLPSNPQSGSVLASQPNSTNSDLPDAPTNSSSPVKDPKPHPFRAVVKSSKILRLKDVAMIETYERMCSYPTNSLFDQLLCTRYYRFRRAIDALGSLDDAQVSQAWNDSDWWWPKRQEQPDVVGFPAQGSASEAAQPPPAPTQDLPLLRRRYDLRQHGLGLIVDFGWGRYSDDS